MNTNAIQLQMGARVTVSLVLSSPLTIEPARVSLHTIHWLPVEQRLAYKVLLIIFRALKFSLPK